MTRARPVRAIAAVALGGWLACHAALVVASRRALPSGGRPGRAVVDGEVVLVPGHRNRADGTPSAVARWRCRIAVRSTDPARAVILFSGGAVVGVRSEASAMAEHAVRRLGVPPDRVRLEERSRTTWENVAESIPLLRDASAIRVASQPFHALRVRRYLAVQAPDLAERLRPARDVTALESLLLGPWMLAHELRRRQARAGSPRRWRALRARAPW